MNYKKQTTRFMKTLIVVESPAKAKKIQKYFDDDTLVRATCGHIRDLDPKTLSVDVDRDFTPLYQTIRGKHNTIKTLSQLAKDRFVVLAADDDREGDSIAWHTGVCLGLDFEEKNRIIFHEVTKSAIHSALQNIHKTNLNSVNAQQARRVIDRLVGYTLSPLLWKHIPSDRKGLSAGRVQSTLLTILQNHEQKVQAFVANPIVKCVGDFKGDIPLKTEYEYNETYLPKDLFECLRENRDFTIKDMAETEEKQYPPKPLITTTLQRCAHTKLRFSLTKTTKISQKLYEQGKITYIRTDSHNISSEFQAKLCNHIKESYTQNIYQPSHTTKKVKGAQEAHECIRVVRLVESLEGCTQDEINLYNLIREHTVCSHMKPAIHRVLKITLHTPNINGVFKGTMKTLAYKGFLEYFGDKHTLETPIVVSPESTFHLHKATHTITKQALPKYLNESSIVKTLESTGIGRPSTYSSIVSTLYTRAYTEIKTYQGEPLKVPTTTLNAKGQIREATKEIKGAKQSGCIMLTELGKQVLRYLEEHFSNIIHVDFTAQVERDLDMIAEGTHDWVTIVRKVYEMFNETAQLQKGIPSQKKGSDSDRNLGVYEKHEVVLKVGKFGPYLSYGDRNVNLKYLLQKLQKSHTDLTLKDVTDTLRYPLHIGNVRVKGASEPMYIHQGPYGTYLKFMKKNYKIPQHSIPTFQECIRYIREQTR